MSRNPGKLPSWSSAILQRGRVHLQSKFPALLLAVVMAVAARGVVLDPDILFYGLGKTKNYTQSGPGSSSYVNFTFNAFVDRRDGGVLSGATLQGPLLGGTQTLTLNSAGADYSASFSGEATTAKGNLNGNFSDSTPGNAGTNYRLDLNTSGPSNPDYSVSFSLAGDSYPVDIPVATTNAGSWQGGEFVLNSGTAVSVGWSFPTYSSATDVILFNVENNSSGADAVDVKFSNGFTGGYTIAAGTLTAGQTYTGRITFARVVASNTTAISGAEGIAFYATETTFTIQAVPEPATCALLALGLGLVAWPVVRRRFKA